MEEEPLPVEESNCLFWFPQKVVERSSNLNGLPRAIVMELELDELNISFHSLEIAFQIKVAAKPDVVCHPHQAEFKSLVGMHNQAFPIQSKSYGELQ